MGVVHLARSPSGERVALKVIRPNVIGDDESRARLAREVNSLLRVRSRRVAEIIDADPWGDVPFVATRYVPGYSLHDQVRQVGTLEGDELVWFARCLAQAIGAVHDVGVVHRDIKPSNILMEGRTPVLIDFGLARLADDAKLTAQGWLLGTPGYLAPEILHGEDASVASDIHSWAATVAFAGTGRAPFGSGPSVAVMDRVRRGEHDLTGLPEEVAEVVLAGLDPEPRNRPTVAAIMTWLDLAEPDAFADEEVLDPEDDTSTRYVPLEPFPVTRPYTQYQPQPMSGPVLHAVPDPEPATIAVPVTPAAAPLLEDPWQASRWPGEQWPQEQRPVDEVEFTDDPWSVPEELEPATKPKVGFGLRLRRATLLLCLGLAVSLGFAASPWVAAAAVTLVVWFVRTLSRTASAAAERRTLRGAKWYDGMQTVAATPVHVFSSLPGTLALLVWAAGLGVVGGLVCFTVGAQPQTTLAAVGAGVALGTWIGPGATRVRRGVAPLVRPFAAHPVVWFLALVASVVGLFAGATALDGGAASHPTSWSQLP
ncbi:hypothetical protein GCM10007231_15310 [Nocardioides daphniae]|uniref:Protein kinase domain-containing protein n=2 Tax=Nocardioides daphniae TaxID=402297 RepID=A0ABQ1Q8Q7_9ACTN|nr:hypothetical protein GCM10007231_15310 [Nocardioides daphniae]